jgi:FkbM family methyltransferase
MNMLKKLEKLLSIGQGKGYGSFSIKNEIRQVAKFIGINPVLAIDIGGNVGNYTVGLVSKYPDLEIHIFEPSKYNVKILENRFSTNKKITVVPRAISAKTGDAILFSDKDGSDLASLTKRKLEHFNIDFNREEKISLIRFDEYWRQTLKSRPMDLVKIDVEGHELNVLAGFGDAISSVKIIQFEFGGCNIDTRTFFQDFWYFFQGNNFEIYRIAPFGVIHLDKYSEMDEYFSTTNFIAVNRNLKNI